MDPAKALEHIEIVRGWSGKTASVYITTDPANRNAFMPRLKSALADSNVPQEIARRIFDAVSDRIRHGLTLAIFANETATIVPILEFQEALAIQEQENGVWIRWGEPVLTPIEHALDRRAAILYVDADHFRYLETFAGEARELDHGTRTHYEQEDQLETSKQVTPAYVPSRGGAAKDLADSHQQALIKRFHRSIAARVRGLLDDDGISRVVVMGRDSAIREVADGLSGVQDVIQIDSAPSHPKAPVHELLERARPALSAMS